MAEKENPWEELARENLARSLRPRSLMSPVPTPIDPAGAPPPKPVRQSIKEAIDEISKRDSDEAGGSPPIPEAKPIWKQFSLDDLIVFIVCECFAAPINIAAGDAFVNLQNGREWYGWGVGVPLALAGFTFHWWKKLLKESAREWIAKTTRRWWFLAVIISILWAYAYVVGPEIYRRATHPTTLTGAIGVMPIGTATNLPPKPLSIEETQFRIDLRKFVLSNVADINQSFGYVLGIQNVPEKKYHPPSSAADADKRVAMSELFQETLKIFFARYKPLADDVNGPMEKFDVSKIISDLKAYFDAYRQAQLNLLKYSKISDAFPLREKLAHWIDADARAYEAFRNLTSYQEGKILESTINKGDFPTQSYSFVEMLRAAP